MLQTAEFAAVLFSFLFSFLRYLSHLLLSRQFIDSSLNVNSIPLSRFVNIQLDSTRNFADFHWATIEYVWIVHSLRCANVVIREGLWNGHDDW